MESSCLISIEFSTIFSWPNCALEFGQPTNTTAVFNIFGRSNSRLIYCSMTPGSTKLNLHWISYHILLVQAVLLEFGRPTNTAEAPVRCSRQTSKTSDIGLSKTNNKIGNLGRSQNPRQKATGPRGYNTILWSIAVTIDSKTYKPTEFYYIFTFLPQHSNIPSIFLTSPFLFFNSEGIFQSL